MLEASSGMVESTPNPMLGRDSLPGRRLTVNVDGAPSNNNNNNNKSGRNNSMRLSSHGDALNLHLPSFASDKDKEELQAVTKSGIATGTTDVDNLLSCLFTVSTFLIGFMTSFLGGLSYDGLSATDKRFSTGVWKIWDHSWFAGSNDQVFLFSALLGFRALTAITTLVTSLFLALASLVGFNFSNCREDKETFQAWFGVYKYVISFAYILFLVGTIYSLSAIVLAGFGNYPKYCDVQISIFGAWSSPSSVLVNGTLTEGCIVEAMQNYQGGVNIMLINVLGPILVVFSLILSIYIKPVSDIFKKLWHDLKR